MIREYALEPEVLSSGGAVRYFLEKFSVPQGRLISKFPMNWKRLVYEACEHCGDVEKKSVLERLKTADRRLMDHYRPPYDPKQTWTQNAIQSHAQQPFEAIIARDAVPGQSAVLVADELEDDNPRWCDKHSKTIARNPDDMADAAAPLLALGREMVFIDPHFNPFELRYREPLKKILTKAAYLGKRKPKRLEFHVGDGDKRNPRKDSKPFDRQKWQENLENCIPKGWELSIIRWKQECLHDRFILTECGVLQFPAGLDQATSTGPQHTQIALLNDAVRERLWKQYVKREDPTMLADNPPSVEIIGRNQVIYPSSPQSEPAGSGGGPAVSG